MQSEFKSDANTDYSNFVSVGGTFPNYQNPVQHGVCPTCGRCSCCGRGPAQQQIQPYYPFVGPTCETK
jgi:hypothetical protein